MANASAIQGYVRDFYRCLRNSREQREEFMLFHPLWEEKREQTLKCLRELLSSLETSETVCEIGIAAGAVGGIGGAVANLVTFISSGTLNPICIGVKAASHGVKAGFASGKAIAVSRARNNVSYILSQDYNETHAFVQMGLQFQGILNEMKGAVENIRQMTLAYTVDELMRELNLPCIAGEGPPQRQLVEAIQQGAEVLNNVDATNVSHILSRYLQHNPDVIRAGRAAAQAGYDLLGFSKLMKMNILGSIGFDTLYVSLDMVSVGADFYDLAKCISNLCAGGSVTQDSIKRLISRLEEEKKLLKIVYERLANL